MVGDPSGLAAIVRYTRVNSSFKLMFLRVVDTSLRYSFGVVYQASLSNDHTASINRVIWSPDGTLFGKLN